MLTLKAAAATVVEIVVVAVEELAAREVEIVAVVTANSWRLEALVAGILEIAAATALPVAAQGFASIGVNINWCQEKNEMNRHFH